MIVVAVGEMHLLLTCRRTSGTVAGSSFYGVDVSLPCCLRETRWFRFWVTSLVAELTFALQRATTSMAISELQSWPKVLGTSRLFDTFLLFT